MSWLNFVPWLPQIKLGVFLLSGLAVVSGSFYFGWHEKGLRDDVVISSVQKSFDDYRLAVVQDAATSNYNVVAKMNQQFSLLQSLQTKLQAQATLNTRTSTELLKGLSTREDAKTLVCPADAAYLDGLRNLKTR